MDVALANTQYHMSKSRGGCLQEMKMYPNAH